MTAQLSFPAGDKATREAADLCARASIRVHEATGERDKDRRERWLAAHILLMTSLGLSNHRRSFAGLTFDVNGIADWRQP